MSPCAVRLLSSLAAHLDTDASLEFYLRFTHALLLRHRNTLSSQLHAYMQLLRRVGRVLGRVKGEVGRLCEDNLYLLQVLSDKRREGGGEEGKEGQTADGEVGEEAKAKIEELKEGDSEDDGEAAAVVVRQTNGRTTEGKKSKQKKKQKVR